MKKNNKKPSNHFSFVYSCSENLYQLWGKANLKTKICTTVLKIFHCMYCDSMFLESTNKWCGSSLLFWFGIFPSLLHSLQLLWCGIKRLILCIEQDILSEELIRYLFRCPSASYKILYVLRKLEDALYIMWISFYLCCASYSKLHTT